MTAPRILANDQVMEQIIGFKLKIVKDKNDVSDQSECLSYASDDEEFTSMFRVIHKESIEPLVYPGNTSD